MTDAPAGIALSPLARVIAARSSDLGRLRLPAPEWGGVFYARPYTLRDELTIGKHIAADNPEGWAELLILKLEAEDGSAALTKADKPVLMRTAEAHVVKRLCMQILASASTPEAEKKDSGATGFSPSDTGSPTG